MVGGFALALGVARAGAGADAGLRAAFVPRSDCAAPCWEGIRPGSTSAADAERLLRQHRWIDDLSAGPSIISWHWSEQAPGYIDSARQGVLYVEHARVWTVRVPLRVPFGDIWALFGPPSQSLLVRPVSRSTAYQIVSYEDIGISVVSSLSCPAGPGVFWASLTTLHLGALTHSDLMNSSPYAVFEQPGWWRWLHTCRRVQLR
jgi:hypothetical protein